MSIKPEVKTALGEVLEHAASLDWTASLYVLSETELDTDWRKRGAADLQM